MSAFTVEDYKSLLKDGVNRYVVSCTSKLGTMYFVRGNVSIDQSAFTNNFNDAYLMDYGAAQNLRDFMEDIYSASDAEFSILKIRLNIVWDESCVPSSKPQQ